MTQAQAKILAVKISRTEVDNIVVFPAERTHLRKLIENDAWRSANKLGKPESHGAILRQYRHVPREIMDKELARVGLYFKSRARHYRRCARADAPSAG